MAGCPIDAEKIDPYKNFSFRLRLPDGTCVAGLSKVSALKRTTEVVKHREKGGPWSSRHLRAEARYESITLERGVTHDIEFHRWANEVSTKWARLGQEALLDDFRKDLILEVFNEAGQVVVAYKIYRCWPSEYESMPELDAGTSAVVIRTLKLENEGLDRTNDLAERN